MSALAMKEKSLSSAMTVRITEAELARDLQSVMEMVRQGSKVVVELDHVAVATITPSESVQDVRLRRSFLKLSNLTLQLRSMANLGRILKTS